MSVDRHNDLIFAHRSDARAAASVTLTGIVAVLIGGVFMALGPRLPDTPVRSGSADGDADAVRVVGTAPQRDAACGEQVWPNIDQRCLVRTDGRAAAAPEKPAAKPAAQDTEPDDGKLTPLTATGATVVGGVTPPDAGKIVQKEVSGTQPAPAQRETVGRSTRVDEASDDADDTDDEPARQRRVRLRFPFHGQIGPFRF